MRKLYRLLQEGFCFPQKKTVDRSQDKNLCSAVRLHELPNSCGKTSSDTACRENCNNIIKKLCKIKRLCGMGVNF